MTNAFNKKLIGQAPEFQAVIRAAQITAATDVTLLLLGESGTGKELMAEAIHAASLRAHRPFVAINCAALQESLAESELFGHRKGAFTGAVSHNPGRIRAANGGTLFLDEVGELPLNIQAKLLRFLESGECQAVGETSTHQADVRIIAATHGDLYDKVRQGLFREDLFYRLNVVPLELPSLRERSSDTPLLIKTFIEGIALQHKLPCPTFTKSAMNTLQAYNWPGNIRELRNLCERMVVLLPGQTIDTGNLPREITCPKSTCDAVFTLPDSGIRLDELEQQMIQQALDKTGGNRSKAARLLGLTRDTLLYRLKKYALA